MINRLMKIVAIKNALVIGGLQFCLPKSGEMPHTVPCYAYIGALEIQQKLSQQQCC